ANFDLKDLAIEVKGEMQGYLKKRQKISFNHTGEKTKVRLDKQLIKNIFFNLLSNASKYSPEGSPIFLETFVDSDLVQIEVRDVGIGIPEKDQVHLSSPFFRAGNVSDIQGTGLGLNIVKRYIDIM